MEEKKTLTADSKIILDALQKYRSQEMDEEFAQSFNTFVNIFAKKFDELKDNLKQQKGETSGKIVQWWEQLALAKPAATQADHFKDYDLCKFKTIHAELAPSENDSVLSPTLQVMEMIVQMNAVKGKNCTI